MLMNAFSRNMAAFIPTHSSVSELAPPGQIDGETQIAGLGQR
jgi:hypothetical protein